MSNKPNIAAGFVGFWRSSALWLKLTLLAVVAVGAWSFLPTKAPPGGPPVVGAGEVVPDPFQECIKRGKAYFASLSTDGRLLDGRRADDVARERCIRTNGAF